ncbi:MAG: hypothetical protein ACRENE_18540 [Polyangiaceae bacterium]
MTKKSSKKASTWAIYGLLGFTAATVSAASCGGTKGGPFQSGPGSSGASSGSGADDGPSGASSGISSSGVSSGMFSSGFGASNGGGSSSGSLPKVEAGIKVDDCMGSTTVSASTVTSLEKGGTPDPKMKMLYPYDQTVFPGGILPPVLQWSPQSAGAPDAVYIHMYSQQFDYKGCFAKSYTFKDASGTYAVANEQLPIPAMRWQQALAQSNGGSDYLNVDVTTITGGTVSGPRNERWIIALGSLKGVIYYNTYNSAISGTNNGAVMQLKAGNPSPTALLAIAGAVPIGPCISCHSVSAQGGMLAAQKHAYPGGLTAPGSMDFDLAAGLPNATNPTPLQSTMADDWGFSAVYPDGSLLLTAGEPQNSGAITGLFPVNNNQNPGMIGPKNNVMYNTTTGATETFTGLQDATAMMPMFSPDGKFIVYNDETDPDGGVGGHGGHGLVVQNFDVSTRTFSNPQLIVNDPNLYPGWPFFTPDNRYVIFASGGTNFASIPPASFSSVGPVQASDTDVAQSDLYVVCLKSPGTAHKLDIAGGFRNGTSYLPFSGTATMGGGSRDDHRNFYPTGSPVSAGGFFWIFFTSRRQYGNVMVDTMNNNAFPDPIWHTESKKIWAAAITEDGMETACASGDISHPAFLLPGQELTSGNIRAFAALAPCLKNGPTSACTAGLDCCGGFCTNGTCGPPPMCSAINDKCSATQPCCAATGVTCLGGYCAVPPPPM